MAAQIREVVDLCDSSDGEAAPPRRAAAAVSRVARAPIEIDDGDDDYGNDNNTNKRGRGSGIEIIDIENDSKKPATKAARTNHDGPAQNQNFQPTTTPTPQTSLQKVQEIFPDVDRTHATQLLATHNDDVAMVMSYLSEANYPKQKNDAPISYTHSSSVVVKRPASYQNHSEPKLDYQSQSSFEPTNTYCTEVAHLLSCEFPFLKQLPLKALIKKYDSHYTLVRQHLHNLIVGRKYPANTKGFKSEEEEERYYHALKNVLASKTLTKEQRRRLGNSWCLQQPRFPKEPKITSPVLADEVVHGDRKLHAWISTVEERLSRRQARKHSQLEGSAVECPCCCDKVSMDEMVACRAEGHLFCVECIKNYVEAQVFSCGDLGTNKRTQKKSSELLCMHPDGCQSGFHEEHLQKALPLKTLEKYNQLQFQLSIDQAGLGESICSCPKCGFRADLPPTEMIFRCPIEDCQTESCRNCGKDPHIPLKCHEVEKEKREDAGRLKVEEAISAAKIRTCPKCSKSFIKQDGCNKMSCPCGAKICYICREILQAPNPYKHFCQTPHCNHKSCNKCTLYSNDEEDDQRAMREAGISAAAAYKNELSSKEGKGPADEIKIDVDTILSVGAGGARKPRRA